MAQAVSIDQAVRVPNFFYEDDTHFITEFFGRPGTRHEGPQGFLAESMLPRDVIRPHFHCLDQFQIVVAGGGRIGKHPLAPVAVHYTDGYTPYGPIVSGDEGISFYTLRLEADAGARFMPESRDQLVRRAGRSFTVPSGLTLDAAPVPQGATTVEECLPAQADGLVAYTLRLAPRDQIVGPDPALGDGQYCVVVNGSLEIDGRELPPRSLVFVSPTDERPIIRAGSGGLEAILAQFPRSRNGA